jgi:hypothetical protein
MNIFYLDKNPLIAARYHHDKHIVKMPTETAQILSTALRLRGINSEFIYKQTHIKHKSVVWVANSWNNFNWLGLFGLELCREYTFRYNKIHKAEEIIMHCLSLSPNKKNNCNFDTPPPQAMPEKYYNMDAVMAYRNYYLFEKEFWYKRDKKTKKIVSKHLNTWKKREKPQWFI